MQSCKVISVSESNYWLLKKLCEKHQVSIHPFLQQHPVKYELCNEILALLREKLSEETTGNSAKKTRTTSSKKLQPNGHEEDDFTSFPITATQTAILVSRSIPLTGEMKT